MKRASKALTGCFSMVVLCCLGLAYVFWHALDGATVRSDVPISDPTKLKDMPVAPPKDARDIYYVFHAEGLQVLYYYMRFSVPPEMIEDAVKAMIANNEMRYKRPFELSTEPIHSPPKFAPNSRFLPMSWWDMRSIKSGYHMKAGQVSYTPEIWVDRAHGTVFVYMID